MIVAYLVAFFAAASLASPNVEKAIDAKPCDAKTGCVHPNFK